MSTADFISGLLPSEGDGVQLARSRLKTLAPRPGTVAATGLDLDLLGDLASKLLLSAGVLNMRSLAQRLAIPGVVLNEVLQMLRREARIGVKPDSIDSDLSYELTERGRQLAMAALQRDGYVGPAPVQLADYVRIVNAQSVHQRQVNRRSMQRALGDLVLSDHLRDRLGAALNSGRAIVLHGPAGTGKTFIARRLERALSGEILIPHAILVNGSVLRLFDPAVHEPIELADAESPLLLNVGFDTRYVCCERPVMRVGGELDPTMLEVERREATHELLAPVQLKANNGLLIVDDLGRQSMGAERILNRWIVPMEERVDHFSTGGGTHFTVPFDVVLVFSTNLDPQRIADGALLRRMGYKIAFGPISPEAYSQIWQRECLGLALPYDKDLVDFAVQELHCKRGVDLLPCHPRDLLNMAVDKLRYDERDRRVDRELLTWAWDNYFLQSR